MGLHLKRASQGLQISLCRQPTRLPLNAIVTPANCFDSPLLPKLIEDLEAGYVLADAGYHSLKNIQAVRDMGAEPVIAVNPRRKGKESKVSNAVFFGGRRWPVEQFNGHCKANVLRGCWVRPKGLLKKASMVMATLISINVVAVLALLEDNCGLKEASRYWD